MSDQLTPADADAAPAVPDPASTDPAPASTDPAPASTEPTARAAPVQGHDQRPHRGDHEGSPAVITILAIFLRPGGRRAADRLQRPRRAARPGVTSSHAPGSALALTWDSMASAYSAAVRRRDLQPGDDRRGLPRRLDRGDLLPAVADRVRGDAADPDRPVGRDRVPGRPVQHRRVRPVRRRRDRRGLARLRRQPADRDPRRRLRDRRPRRRRGARLVGRRAQGADRRARGDRHDHAQLRDVRPAAATCCRSEHAAAAASVQPDRAADRDRTPTCRTSAGPPPQAGVGFLIAVAAAIGSPGCCPAARSASSSARWALTRARPAARASTSSGRWALVMLISGGLAGLAAATVILGTSRRRSRSTATAPTASTASRSRCSGGPSRSAWCFAGLLFGALHVGGTYVEGATLGQVPADIVQVLEGLIVLFVAAPAADPGGLPAPLDQRHRHGSSREGVERVTTLTATVRAPLTTDRRYLAAGTFAVFGVIDIVVFGLLAHKGDASFALSASGSGVQIPVIRVPADSGVLRPRRGCRSRSGPARGTMELSRPGTSGWRSARSCCSS